MKDAMISIGWRAAVAVAGTVALVLVAGATAPVADAEVGREVILRVEGMHSVFCAAQVRSTLEGLEGVAKATVDRESAEALVEYDPARVTPEAMAAAVDAVGYRASLPEGSESGESASAGHAVTTGRLSAAQIEQVAEFVAGRLLDGEEVPAGEQIAAATGIEVALDDVPAVQAAVVSRLTADPRGRELLAGGRCNDYGACSLWRNLAGASGEVLARYERDRARDGELIESTALPEFAAQDLEGEPVRSAELTGRPALVTLLAVHCTHSMDTFPVLQRIHERFGPRGLQVVGVLVHSGSAADARGWVPRFAPEYPIWVHEDASLGDRVGSRLVPTYLLIDAEGRMRQILVGFKSERQVVAALESTLGLGAS